MQSDKHKKRRINDGWQIERNSKEIDIDENQEIVAYCRGPHCVLAFDAVARLREKGINARRLEYGYPEWKNAGLPIEQTH